MLHRHPAVKNIFAKIRGLHLTRRRVIIATTTVLIGIVGATSWYSFIGPDGIAKIVPNAAQSEKIAQNPQYATLLPDGKSVDALGGWHRVSPADHNPVFAYADNVEGISVAVSEQPIPDSFQPNIDKSVADLASSYLATDKISTGSITIYVGTSAKGPQSVIFTKNNVLVLIKSAQKIDDDAWAAYAQALN